MCRYRILQKIETLTWEKAAPQKRKATGKKKQKLTELIVYTKALKTYIALSGMENTKKKRV